VLDIAAEKTQIVAGAAAKRTRVLDAQIARRLSIWDANAAHRIAAMIDAVAERLASTNSDTFARLAARADANAAGNCVPAPMNAIDVALDENAIASQAAQDAIDFGADFDIISIDADDTATANAIDCASEAAAMLSWFASHASTFGDAAYLAKEVDLADEAEACDTEFDTH
jgi:hypothetical protein